MADQTDNIRLLLQAIDQATGVIDKARAAITQVTAATNTQNAAAKQNETIQARLGGVIANNSKTFLVLGAAATAAATAFALLGKHGIDAADELSKFSQKTGVAVETASTLKLAAEEADLSLADLGVAFKEQAKSALEATKANTAGSVAYQLLGISAEDLAGKLKDPFQLFLATADGLKGVEDANLRAAIAQNLFGRSGTQLLPLLKDGRAGIEELQATYADLGATITTQAGEASEHFNDQTKRLNNTIKIAAQQIGLSFLPVLTKVNDILLNNAKVIQVAAVAFTTLVGAAIATATAYKTLSISSQLLSAAFGLGPLKNLKDYTAALQLAAGTSMGPLLIGIVAVTAAVAIGVTAWQAYAAAQKDASSFHDLAIAQQDFRERIQEQITVQRDLGNVTVEEAARMQDALDKAFASKNPELQNRAIQDISKGLREAQGLATGAGKTSGGGISIVESPELAKAKADAGLAIVKSSAGLAKAERDRTAATEDRALEDQLKNRLITVADFEAQREALTARRLADELAASNTTFDAETTALVKQQEDLQKRIAGTTAQQQLADPGALDQLRQQKVAIDAQIETLETDHQAALQGIRSASEGETAKQEEDLLNLRRARAAEEIDFNNRRADSLKSLLEGNAKQLQNEADLKEILNQKIPLEATAAEAAQLRIQADQTNAEAQRVAEEARFEAQISQIGELQILQEDRDKLAEDAERVHQQNLLLIAQDAGNQKAAIEQGTQEKIQGIRDGQLTGAQNIFKNLASASESSNKQGFSAYKAFASASALIDTYKSAQAAYSSVAGIPFVGPALAVAAAAAAIAAGLANVAKINSLSFEEGGLVPGTPSAKDNRVANVAAGEYIFDTRSVQKMGPAWFAGMHNQIRTGNFDGSMAIARARNTRGFAEGGLVGDTAGAPASIDAGGGNVSVAFVNTRNAQRKFHAREGVKITMDELEERGNTVLS